MEFRSPVVAQQQNAQSVEYLTKSLQDPNEGGANVRQLLNELGNAIEVYPDWHPLLTAPPKPLSNRVPSFHDIKAYDGLDHTIKFVRGFVTCPYSEKAAERLSKSVREIDGLHAYRLDYPLYSDQAYPVVVEAVNVQLEGDGTVRSRDALAWFAQHTASMANWAQVAETWWNIRSNILGSPHGSRSSLFVSQHTGSHMRKILEAMNASGMFGPVRESSLDMLSPRKRASISEMLIRTAVANWDQKSEQFTFELRGETCKASLRDTWNDNCEISVRVQIGDYDLYVTGFYYPKENKITHTDPEGKRHLAEKFI